MSALCDSFGERIFLFWYTRGLAETRRYPSALYQGSSRIWATIYREFSGFELDSYEEWKGWGFWTLQLKEALTSGNVRSKMGKQKRVKTRKERKKTLWVGSFLRLEVLFSYWPPRVRFTDSQLWLYFVFLLVQDSLIMLSRPFVVILLDFDSLSPLLVDFCFSSF